MADDFADHPRSLAEVKSDRAGTACLWTPRDALISLLRDIDSGKVDPDTLIICWRPKPETDEQGRVGVAACFVSAGKDPHVTTGLLMSTIQKINRQP